MMAEINLEDLLGKMLNAAMNSFQDKWPKTREYGKSEFEKIGKTILFIQKEVIAGRMSEEKAKLHMNIQINSAKMVLLTIEGLETLAVESAINEALAVVKDTVNTSLGFVLI